MKSTRSLKRYLQQFASVLCSVSLLVGVVSAADVKEGDRDTNVIVEDDALLQEVSSFIEESQGRFWFNEVKAEEEGASSEVLSVGQYYNQFGMHYYYGAPFPTLNIPDDEYEDVDLGYYGNWCGPGNGGGTPIDLLDRICMRHDECYDTHGYWHKTCDEQFVRTLEINLDEIRKISTRAYYYALAAIAFFKGI